MSDAATVSANATGAATPTTPAWTLRQGLSYGSLGAALAFVALPLYVLLPNHYARECGVSLSTLGAVLLGARLLDALIDPALGRWVDRLFARSVQAVLAAALAASALLAIGFIAIFFPPVRGAALVAWAALALLLTYAAYSFVSVAHQSWGARLGGDAAFRTRVAVWREAPGLLGVLLASSLPVIAGLPVMLAVFIALLAIGLWAWTHAPRPLASVSARDADGRAEQDAPQDLWQPWRNPRFRRLLAVFVLNGVASSVPATLVLFFVQDRLQVAPSLQAVFLGGYFLAGALAMGLWLQLVQRIGLAWGWLLSMGLSVAVFVWAATLGAGDTTAFFIVCVLSGVALGADLAFPSALLTGAIQAQGDAGRHEGAYYGWWNFANKLNMALAAGLALPLLEFFGYSPGARSPEALQALTIAYCLLPCALKLIAASALYTLSRGQKLL